MASAPAVDPIPGAAAPGAGYPQYGVSDVSGAYAIVTARSAAQKTADLSKDALVWFGTRQAAQEFISGQTSAINDLDKLPALDIGGSFLKLLDNLTARALWVRIAKVVIGTALILTGINRLTGAATALDKVARVIPA